MKKEMDISIPPYQYWKFSIFVRLLSLFLLTQTSIISDAAEIRHKFEGDLIITMPTSNNLETRDKKSYFLNSNFSYDAEVKKGSLSAKSHIKISPAQERENILNGSYLGFKSNYGVIEFGNHENVADKASIESISFYIHSIAHKFSQDQLHVNYISPLFLNSNIAFSVAKSTRTIGLFHNIFLGQIDSKLSLSIQSSDTGYEYIASILASYGPFACGLSYEDNSAKTQSTISSIVKYSQGPFKIYAGIKHIPSFKSPNKFQAGLNCKVSKNFQIYAEFATYKIHFDKCMLIGLKFISN